MLLTVLPFFLAAHILDDGDPFYKNRWQNKDLESTYEIVLNMSLPIEEYNKNVFCSIIRIDLKCRPKSSDTLFCHFRFKEMRDDEENARSYHRLHGLQNGNNNGCTMYVPQREDDLVKQEPFEIRFNEQGVENLVINRNISRWYLDMIKLIVAQLHVGMNLRNPQTTFTALENSTNTYCETAIMVMQNKDSSNFSFEAMHEDNFKITLDSSITAFNLDQDDKVLNIEKIRNPDKCPGRQMYFLGKHRNFGIFNESASVIMKSSISRMIISKTGFSSFTVSEGVIKPLNVTTIFQPKQNISVILKSIAPAQSELLEIQNPASTSIHAFSNFDRIYK